MDGLALSSGKQDLLIDPPIMNSAGILGYSPDNKHPFDFDALGAFVTHPISLKRRSPASTPRFLTYPGGVLLHTGLPNPGLRSALSTFTAEWNASQKPIILHLLPQGPGEMKKMAALIDDGGTPLHALEIGLSEDATPQDVEAILDAAALSQLPILARITPEADQAVLQAAAAGSNAIVIGPPRGSMFTQEDELISGRLYGPGTTPWAYRQLGRFLQTLDIPVILGFGMYSAQDVQGAFTEGASAVQLDTVLWLDPGRALEGLF